MSHPNSRHTALGRWQFVRMVVREGSTFEDAAARSNVARSTVWEWVCRWRAASDADRASLVCLADRSSRPRCSPTRVPGDEERRICELRRRTGWGPRLLAEEAGRPHSTVHRVLQRAGCSRRPAAEREAIVRYEWPCPGQLLHMDVKKFARFTEPGHKTTGDRTRRSRRAGWEYVHSIVDDYSRLAYSEICEDERAETVRSFTERALDFYLEHGIVAERLMTDNHMSYRCSHSFARLLTSRPNPALPNPTLHAPHQREGGALPTNPRSRVGLRHAIRLKHSPSRSPATLAQPLQQAAPPLSHRQPATPHPPVRNLLGHHT